MKKINFLLLAVIGLLCSVSVSAEDFEVDGIYYNITSSTNKTVEVTFRGKYYESYSNEYSGAVTIPESVTYNGNTYSVTSIEKYAFYYCSSLTSIELPNSVTSIEKYAFYNCSGLTSIVVDKGNSIYDSREDCNAIIKSASNELIVGCNSTTIPNSVTSIGEMAFYGCSGLTSIKIPNSVTSIGIAAFADCVCLSSVEIGNNVTSIGNSAFSGCSSLTSIEIPNSVTSIEDGAFYGCSGLTSVEIGNCVATIGWNAFGGCSGLISIIVDKENSIYDSREDCNAIIKSASNKLIVGCNSTTIPNSVTSIDGYAFSHCSGLITIVIPNSVTSIGNYAFSDALLRTIISESSTPAILQGVPFNNYTYIHAPLYIPEGAYWNYAYAYGWGDFIHIKEMAMTEEALLSNKAYMIADSKGTNFKVYDAERDALKNVEYTHALDEESEDCCWTVMKEDGKTYLFNLGAKKFGVVGDNGAITLSETPVHVAISETEGGLSINGNNCMFVLNKHVEVDATGISEVLLNGQDVKNAQIHSLDGRRQQTLKRGVNIVNGKKVFVQ